MIVWFFIRDEINNLNTYKKSSYGRLSSAENAGNEN